jgi:hypothetical protein
MLEVKKKIFKGNEESLEERKENCETILEIWDKQNWEKD